MAQLRDICENCGNAYFDHYGEKCPHPSGAKKAGGASKFKPKEKEKE